MNENPSIQYLDIDDFVKSLSSGSKKKAYEVVMALLDEADLTGSNVIKIPFHRLNKNNSSDEDSIAVLKNLHRKDIASTLLTIIEHKGDKEKPSIGLCKSIVEDDEVFNSRARIHIKKNRLKYLEQQLEKWLADESTDLKIQNSNYENKGGLSSDLNRIKHITVVEKNNRNKSRVIIDEDYAGSFEIFDSTSKNIHSLVNAIIDKTDTLKNITNLLNCRDYLNSNSNCRLYKSMDGKKQIYAITPIVEFKDRYASGKELRILSKIKTHTITHTEYNKLLSKQKNRNKAQEI